MSTWLTSTAVAVAILARVAAGEAGVQTDTRDVGAIWRTALAGGERRGISATTWLRSHSGAHLRQPHARPWIPALRPGPRAPRGWPAALPWRAAWRARVDALWARARALVAGRAEPPCPLDRPPHTWGSDADWARYQRLHPHAYEVDCQRTKNHFVRAW